MAKIQKSLIDNWSLEQAGSLLDGNNDLFSISEEEFITSLGGLSNYINSILLYDETNFLANGFEGDWVRFGWFEKNTRLIVQPINPESLKIDWNSEASYSDKGIRNYLASSHHLKTDLFISPQRAERIKDNKLLNTKNNLNQTLLKIDEKIKSEKDSLWFDDLKVGIDKNFNFPSLTHYVLSQATSSDDLLTVIMQLKESGRVKSIRDKIDEITQSTKEASKFQKDIERLIKENFGEAAKNDKPWSIKFTVLFLTLTKSFNLDFFKRKEHLLFLKDIIACRTEAQGLDNNIKRLFRRNILNK
ncbi:MAG TPA: hypothetical protein PLP23_15150 [Panacibacter sp.]|nr:hypothetical protein [Panacibacter sp.]